MKEHLKRWSESSGKLQQLHRVMSTALLLSTAEMALRGLALRWGCCCSLTQLYSCAGLSWLCVKANDPRCTLVADLLLDWIGRLMPRLDVCAGHLERSDHPQSVFRNLAIFLKTGSRPTPCQAFPELRLKTAAAAGTDIVDMDERLRQLMRQIYMRCGNLALGPQPEKNGSDRSPPRRRAASREARTPVCLVSRRERSRSRSVLHRPNKRKAAFHIVGHETGSHPWRTYSYGGSKCSQDGASDSAWRKIKWTLRKQEQSMANAHS